MLKYLLVLLALLPCALESADQKPLVVNPATGKNEQIQPGNFLTVPNSSGVLIRWVVGTSSPESVVTAGVGSVFYRTDGGAGTTMYVKESGAGNTGWFPLAGGASIGGSIANAQVAFGSGANTIQGLADFTFDNATNVLQVVGGAIEAKTSGGVAIQLDPNSATGDFAQRFSSANLTAHRRFTLPNADTTITGGGTLGLGGFTLTVPATDTAALLGQTQTITGAKTFSAVLDVSNTTEATAVNAAAVVNAGGQGVAKRSFLGTIGGTFKGNVLAGVQDGTVAVAGQVGQEIKTTVGSAACEATGTVGNVCWINLTPGDWLLSGYFTIDSGSTGLTAGSVIKCSIVATSATNGTSGDTMQQQSVQALIANGLHAMSVPALRVSVTVTTTYYLTEQVSYVAGSPVAGGTLTATRVR